MIFMITLHSYSTGSNENLVCNKITAPWSSIFCSQCSQLNRNKNHVINLLLHEELSWRLLTKLPESISTFRIVQKMWLQWPFFYTCTKRFGIEEVYNMYVLLLKTVAMVNTESKRFLISDCLIIYKWAKCGKSGKTFFWSGQLKIYWGIHTDRKPFKCTQCGNSLYQVTWKTQ